MHELLAMVLGHGAAPFSLTSEGPQTIQRFGEEVASVLREAGHAGATAGWGHERRGAPRPERAGPPTWSIDYRRLPGSVSTKAIEPGDKRYGTVRPPTPVRVTGTGARARRLDDVIAAVVFALTATSASSPAPLASAETDSTSAGTQTSRRTSAASSSAPAP